METLYKTIMQYDGYEGDLSARLLAHGILDLFQPLHTRFVLLEEDYLSFSQSVMYIVQAYSFDSDALQKGVSWDENKQRIAVNLSIEQNNDLYLDLVDQRDPDVVESINRYLDYQQSESWQHLISLKELYVELVNSARAPIKKLNGTVDYRQKVDNMKFADDIFKSIHEKQQEFDEEIALKAGVKELRQVTKADRKTYTIRIENIAARVREQDITPKKDRKADDPEE